MWEYSACLADFSLVGHLSPGESLPLITDWPLHERILFSPEELLLSDGSCQ